MAATHLTGPLILGSPSNPVVVTDISGNATFDGVVTAAGFVGPITPTGNVSITGTLTVSSTTTSAGFIDTSGGTTDNQQFVGLDKVLNYSAGTWTRTRVALGDYAQVKTPGNDTTILGVDITPQIRLAASKGFKLASIDIISLIGVAALDAHTATLSLVNYVTNIANAITNVPLTGTLPIATQANPYVTNLTVTTPAFDNAAVSKYVFELTVNAALTSTYSYYGLNLHFTNSVF